MTGAGALNAVLRLRVSQGVRAGLPWLIVPAFLLGLVVAWWAPGATPEARAMAADRALPVALIAMGMLLAAIPSALSFPLDLNRGSAIGWLTAPVPRWALVVGGALGHWMLAIAVLFGMGGAALLGLELGGLGARAREPLRTYHAAECVSAERVATRDRPVQFEVVLPVDAPRAPIVVRGRPEPRLVGESFPPLSTAVVAVRSRDLANVSEAVVEFQRGADFVARVDRMSMLPGIPVVIEVSSGDPDWELGFERGGVEVGGLPEPFLPSFLLTLLAASPLLLLVSAASTCGAVRFGAPTAVALATTLLVMLGARGLLLDAAAHIEWGARAQQEDAARGIETRRVTAAQETLAMAVRGLYGVVPDPDRFLAGDRLVARRTVGSDFAGDAVLGALPLTSVLLLAGWGLLATREFD